MSIVLLPLMLLVASATPDRCGCYCVDGQSLSLCTAIERAALGEQHCTAATQCALPGTVATPLPADQRGPLSAPAGARDCRYAAVSHPGSPQQHQVAICDVVGE